MKISFPYDLNVDLELPEQYLLADGRPHPWFDQYKFNISEREPRLRRVVSSLISEGIIDRNKSILDSGAFIGDNSLPWARCIQGTVYAVDPSPANIALIEMIASMNNITNIICIPKALSHARVELGYTGSIDFNSFTHGSAENSIISESIDLLFGEGIIRNIDFLHLDVEGGELDAIKGGLKLIDESQPVIIFESHVILENNLSPIVRLLEMLNYTVFMIDEISGANLDCRNFLAIPSRSYGVFCSTFSDSSMLIRRSFWDDEISRIESVINIEKSLLSLRRVCKHGYEIAKMRAVLDQCEDEY